MGWVCWLYCPACATPLVLEREITAEWVQERAAAGESWARTEVRDRAAGIVEKVAAPVLDTDYREGLPSVETVRAHEARGGWWIRHWGEGLDFNRLAVGRADLGEAVRLVTADGRHVYPHDGGRSRPCTIDGDSLPWLDVSGG